MIKRYYNQIMIYTGLLTSVLLGAWLIEKPTYFFGMLILMLAVGIITMLIGTMYAYAFLITFILVIAFYNVGVSWGWHWNIREQSTNILTQAIISFGAIMSWLSGYAIQKNHQILQSLRNEINILKKYEALPGILTFNEFLERAEILFTGLKRRKESGYFIHFVITERKDYKVRVIRDKLSNSIIDSIRMKFDLVGQLTPHSLLLLLNNSSQQGVEIVLQRIKDKLGKAGVNEGLYEIEVISLLTEWDENLERIHLFQRRPEEG